MDDGIQKLHRQNKDISNMRFGRLTAMWPAGYDKHRKRVWLCLCECGNTMLVIQADLITGHTKACGCTRRKSLALRNRATTPSLRHGHSRRGKHTPEYRCWNLMLGRCRDRRRHDFAHYGARGITVCERWQKSFEDFLADVGQKPFADFSLDRIDNTRGYEPGNCRWASPFEQANNTRSSRQKGFSSWDEVISAAADNLLKLRLRAAGVQRTITYCEEQKAKGASYLPSIPSIQVVA